MARSAWEKVNKRKLFERFAIEIGPALVFVAALQLGSLNLATALFVLSLFVAATYSWIEKRRLPYIPFAMAFLAAVFGALTILFGNAAFIEVRSTVVNAGGALAILFGLLTGRLFLKRSLQDGFSLNDGAWWVLSLRMMAYLFAMAALNEVVWRTFSTETWAWFKAAAPVLNLIFLLLNWPLIRDNLSGEGRLDESPPAGGKTALNPARAPREAPMVPEGPTTIAEIMARRSEDGGPDDQPRRAAASG